MRCGHLFNGIGGFALAAHWMGWQNVMHCEIDPFCNRVMAHHFPNSKKHEDIRNTDFSIYRGQVDLLTGGFPCQPYSTAGKRLGKADARHLWPEKRRAVREIRPRWVVPENVRGLVNWNDGLVFDEVCADLEAEGYEVLPFLLPAAGVNAPHRRDRIWFVAYAGCRSGSGRQNQQGRSEHNGEDGNRGEKADKSERLRSAGAATYSNSDGHRGNDGLGEVGRQAETAEGAEQREGRDKVQWQRDGCVTGGDVAEGITAYPNSQQRCEGGMHEEGPETSEQHISPCGAWANGGAWQNFPTQFPICLGDDGLSSGLVSVSVPGRRGRRTLTEKQALGRIRKESLKAAGNAIVPQVAFQIFKAIEAYENY